MITKIMTQGIKVSTDDKMKLEQTELYMSHFHEQMYEYRKISKQQSAFILFV